MVQFIQSTKFDLLGLFLLSAFTCRSLFSLNLDFVAGTDSLGIRSYMSMWSYLEQNFKSWLFTWTPFQGGGLTTNLPVPIFLVSSVVSVIFSSLPGFVTFITKMMLFLLFPIASFSMYLFTYNLLKSRSGSFIAALFYMYNQFFLSEHISEGHFIIAFGYALAPLILLMLEKVIRFPNMKNVLILSIILLFFLDSRSQSTYIMSLLAAVYIFIRSFQIKHDMKSRIKGTIAILLAIGICVLLSAYWLVPEMFVVKNSSVLFRVYHSIDDAYKFGFNSIIDALSIRSSSENIFGQRIPFWEIPILQQTELNFLILIIPALAFMALIFKRDRVTKFFTIVALFASFLALGPNGLPFEIFVWLWTHVPGYSTFRVGGRFLMVTALAYSYLISITVDSCSKRIRSWVGFDLEKQASSSLLKKIKVYFGKYRVLEKLFVVIVIIIIFLYSWVGSVEGFKVYTWPDEYIEPFQWIGDQPGDYRIVTTPYQRLYSKYSWSSATLDLGVFSFFIHNKGVFVGGSGYIADYTPFVGNLLRSNLTNSLSSLLGIAGVRYIVSEPDTNLNEKLVLEKQNNLVPIQIGNVSIFEILQYSEHIFTTENSALVFGGRNSITSLLSVNEFELNKWTLLFYDQVPQLNLEYDQTIFAGVTLQDIAFLTYGWNDIIQLADYAFPSANQSKYWTSHTQLLDKGFLMFSGSTLTTKGRVSIDIPLIIQEEGQYELWMRIAYGPDRGKLTIEMDGQTIESEIYPYVPYPSGLHWIKLQNVFLSSGSHVITLTNDGNGYNDVDVIAVIQPDRLESVYNKALNDIQDLDSRVINVIEAETAFAHNLNGWYPSERWGCNASNGVTLTSDTLTLSSAQIFIPKDGNYKIAVRTVESEEHGNLLLQVDDGNITKLECNSSTTRFVWHEVDPVPMNRGEHILNIINDGIGKVDLDEIIIYSLKETEESTSIKELFSPQISQLTQFNYTQITPTEYEVKITTDEPFWLIFSESFNPLWRAYIDNEEIEKVVAYSFMNGFHVDKTGDLVIQIYFTGQTYFYIGSLISVSTLFSGVIYLKWIKKFKILKKLMKVVNRV